jgi:hypothetical protein
MANRHQMNASARPDEPGLLALANGIYLIDVPLQLPYRHTLLEFVMAKLTFVLPFHDFRGNLSPDEWPHKHFRQLLA